MTLNAIKDKQSIKNAINEFNKIGREAFLKKYGFRKAREYFLEVDGNLFDSKAIVGAAHGYEFPKLGPLRADQFVGGADTVERKLRELGFNVVHINRNGIDNALKEAEEEGVFNPLDAEDGRKKILAAIVRRQGQPAFRRELFRAYAGRCAISGCLTKEVLEAAHIVPYRGPQTNHVTNGLLLRADIHTLFDLGLIAVDPIKKTVIIAESLKDTDYEQWNGQCINLPELVNDYPSEDALRSHLIEADL
jgi:hypothetical protein